MPQTPFHAYYTARLIDASFNDRDFTPVFASSNIKIYPFQVAAAAFALKSSYQKGVILCDEAGMGKSHEAMLVITQKWLEGCKNILLCITNSDLLVQWTELLDTYYTIPYIALTNNEMYSDNGNSFEQDGIIIST